MCIGGLLSSKTSVPAPPAVVPEAAQMPEEPTTGTTASADKRRRAAASGASGTILTGARGVTQQGVTATKTLLGE